MRPRALAVCAATLVFGGAVLFAPAASATGPPVWSGAFDQQPDSVLRSGPGLTGFFSYGDDHCAGAPSCPFPYKIDQIAFETAFSQGHTPSNGACTTPAKETQFFSGTGDPVRADFLYTPALPCNGVYDFTATASGSINGFPVSPPDHTISVYTVTVAVPAPAVKNMKASVNSDRSVSIAWDPLYAKPADGPPDFQGYKVQRVTPSETKVLGTIAPGAPTSFIDKTIPDAGGSFSYEVLSLRAGAAPTTVKTEKPLAVPAVDGTPPSTPGTSSSGGVATMTTSTIDPIGATGPRLSVTPGTPTAPRSAASPPAISENPAVGAGQGFSSDLPYEPGGLAAAPGSVRARNNEPGAGLLVPAAVSLLLFVWAMHILYLTRQARYAEAGLLSLPVTTELSTESAPDLSSGSFQDPHLGDWMQEGQPAAHWQPAMTSRVALRWRSAAANPSSAIPAPPE